MKLLTRDEFRESVLKRDANECAVCHEPNALSVHHILERKLWEDGGYYLNNGITLCPNHHILAESCFIMPERLWELLKIKVSDIPYPKGLDHYEDLDKWGQTVLYDGIGEVSVIPNQFQEDFLKAVRLAGGMGRVVSPEWMMQYKRIVCKQNVLYVVKGFKIPSGGDGLY